MMKTKRCSKCEKVKSIKEFTKNKNYSGGVYCWCRDCARDAVYVSWRKNPERYRSIKKRAYEKRKHETGLTGYESKETKAKRMAIYREKNREKLRRQSRERYHRMVQTEDGKRYWRALVRRRLDGGSFVSADMIKSIEQSNIKKYGILTCAYCGIEIEDTYHLEHKTPISRGGKSVRINLCIACPQCNLSKGALTAAEYRKRLRIVS